MPPPPANSPPFKLLGRAGLWEASLPHTLWLPKPALSQHLLHWAPSAEGDRSDAGPRGRCLPCSEQGLREDDSSHSLHRDLWSGTSLAFCSINDFFPTRPLGRRHPISTPHPTLSADEESEAPGGTEVCLRVRAGNQDLSTGL